MKAAFAFFVGQINRLAMRGSLEDTTFIGVRLSAAVIFL
jgi:hypothetical protein